MIIAEFEPIALLPGNLRFGSNSVNERERFMARGSPFGVEYTPPAPVRFTRTSVKTEV